MLVLSRKEGESIEFRDLNVCVRVIQLKKSKVQLGIEAPRTIQVDRTEVRRSAARIGSSSLKMQTPQPMSAAIELFSFPSLA